ncbi:MAG: Histidyl-tRNA synthetase [uncultured bacterium (gcode 4)]|uniref:Histidine--tRNA ligase n=1 Tax=uncultured bacterium (gcode 4) TaxID=1234023 RepID=K2GFW5_9BACT|nr:MAG: Histidyl-tRNA synthetase [uncultured bacterium (gcode 4)]
MEIPQKVRGMQDIYGEYQRYFTFLKKVSRHEFRKNWFTRISTPILEKVDLIKRSIWEDTDIVSKEMYNIIDKKWRELVMKPESTAWIMRSYIENFLDETQPVYYYYIEPHFRYERPQKWRYRQFNQIGAEIIWEIDPVLDAKLIYIWKSILDSIWLKDSFKVKINSIWTSKEREKYIEALKDFFANKKQHLDDNDLHRLENNPLRILDSKNPDTQELLKFAPKVTDFLKKESKEFYESVKEYLEILGVDYVEDHTLVRGLDYYCHTVWEFVDFSGRSQDALGWGWRYDELAKSIGHKTAIPAVGFAFGAERLIEHIMEAWVKLKNKDVIQLYFIQLWDEAKKIVLPLNIEARNKWLNSQLSLWTPSMKVQMKKANKINARFVAIVGIMEAKNWVCQLKDMESGTQEEVKLENLLDHVITKVWKDSLDFYDPAKDFIIVEPIKTEE